MKEMCALQEAVLQFIRREELVHFHDHVLAAVSGGPDSVALLHLLVALKDHLGIDSITVLHFDHRLRGEASRQDRLFVQSLAAGLGLPFHCRSHDVRTHAQSRHLSLEMAARECRHRFFQDSREKFGAHSVALGHNTNDQAEEILLRLFRGTGPSGLAGMLPRANSGIIRPLLFATRGEILRYLEDLRLAFKDDSSNREAFCQRNKLRLEVFPLLEKSFHSRVVENLARVAELVRTEEEYWTLQVERHWPAVLVEESPQRMVLSLSGLAGFHPALLRRLLRSAIQRFQGHLLRIYADHIERLCHMVANQADRDSMHLPGGLRARIEAHRLVLYTELSAGGDTSVGSPVVTIPSTGVFHLTDFGFSLFLREIDRSEMAGDLPVSSADIACFDAQRIRWPLLVRFWRPGDRFQPLGMSGTKKLQDFFTDAKVPKQARGRIPLLCDPDRICWVMGYRLNDQVKVTAQTESLLLAERRKCD